LTLLAAAGEKRRLMLLGGDDLGRHRQTEILPASPEDMTKHRLVQQVAPQIDDSIWGKLLGL
jgi:hypothetical protein